MAAWRRIGTGGLAVVLAATLYGCSSADTQEKPASEAGATSASSSQDDAESRNGSEGGTEAQDDAEGQDDGTPEGNGATAEETAEEVEAQVAEAFRAAADAEPGEPAVVEDAGTGEERRATAETVSLDEPASPAEGLEISIESTEPVQAEGMGPGGMSGPAVAVVVTVRNTTDAPVETLGGTVTVSYGPDALPADLTLQRGDRTLPDVVAAGQTVSGTYTFLVPEDQRENLTVTASYRASDPAVVFTGGATR
ncbi:hypothetical protein [Kocuria sp. NPDC057446]|uniref:hypothetical protein n=1 Tax=Kocuria sp. NPDC057446 TaxID=3346137 RepID=UPI0036AA6DFE